MTELKLHAYPCNKEFECLICKARVEEYIFYHDTYGCPCEVICPLCRANDFTTMPTQEEIESQQEEDGDWSFSPDDINKIASAIKEDIKKDN